MKKEKPIRKNLSQEELRAYFSSWQFDPARQCINKIMREHPEVKDAYVISAAADEMFNSASTGVLLSSDDALRLVAYMEPMPVKTAVNKLTEAGITNANIMDIIFDSQNTNEDYSDCVWSRHALYSANRLQRYANILTRNKDILLLMLPEYSQQCNWTSIVLAFLGEELSAIEQQILEQMKNVADGFHMKTEYEVTRISFYIDNVWEKP